MAQWAELRTVKIMGMQTVVTYKEGLSKFKMPPLWLPTLKLVRKRQDNDAGGSGGNSFLGRGQATWPCVALC